MTDTYKLPVAIAAAMATSRHQLVDFASELDLQSHEVRRLLKDLIEDRFRLVQQINKLESKIESALGNMTGSTHSLEQVLEECTLVKRAVVGDFGEETQSNSTPW